MGSVAHFHNVKKEFVKEVHILARLGVRLEDSPKEGSMVHHNSESSLVVEVKSKQYLHPILMELKKFFLIMFNEAFSQWGDEILRYQDRLCVSYVDGLMGQILEEAHVSSRCHQMYRDLQEIYWWDGFERDIAEFMAK